MQDCAVKCPWAETWKAYDLCQYGAVYCRNIDAALGRGFDEAVVIESKANLTEGAPHCDIWFRGAAHHQSGDTARLNLDQRARLPWVYHLAHLYRVFSDTLEERAGGEQTRTILDCARDDFQQITQKENSCGFLELCGLDFDGIGDN